MLIMPNSSYSCGLEMDQPAIVQQQWQTLGALLNQTDYNLSVVPFICWWQSSLAALSAPKFAIARQYMVTIFKSTSSDVGELLF